MFPSSDDLGELSELPLERLEHELTQFASRLNAGTCRWLELVAEFDRRQGWSEWGSRSCADWLAWQCAVTPRAAREHVRVARSLEGLPRIHAGFSAGELSYSKVRALTRVASAEAEGELLELARHATAAQLERMLRAYRRYSSEDAVNQQRAAYVSWRWDEDGCLELNARLAPEDGALFLKALEQARDSLWAERREQSSAAPGETSEESASATEDLEGGSAEPRVAEAALPCGSAEPPPSHAEALTCVAETALARGPTASPPADRQMVTVHVDAATLTCDDPHGHCHLEDGPSLAPETSRRLTCDCSLVGVLESNGEPLAIGRRSRSIPPAMRRALEIRDGGCYFPGCNARKFVDGHHIQHWAQGGKTELDNLVLLCRHHHRMVHERGYRLARTKGGEITVRHPAGRVMEPSPALPHVDGVLATPQRPLLTGTGEKMDYRACVDAVFGICERPEESSLSP
jgi:hypothetical protein